MKAGHAIKLARQARRLTQDDVATALGVSQHYISMLENDRRQPSWSFMCKLAEFLEIPLPQLLLQAMPDDEALSIARLVAQELSSLYEDNDEPTNEAP